MFDYMDLVDELALAIAFQFHAMIVMLEAREMAIEQLHRQQVINNGLVISAGFFAGHHQRNARRIRDDLYGVVLCQVDG